MGAVVAVRPARRVDVEVEALRRIEVLAGAAFADVGLPEIAQADPMSAEDLFSHASAGRAWVTVDDRDEPVGYVVVDVVDGCAHVEQITVHPDRQGTGLGRRLLQEVEQFAAERDMPAVTLTAFADVPWNGPLYAHLGFVVLSDHELGPGLRALREEEARHGLDPVRRVCMRRDVSAARRPA